MKKYIVALLILLCVQLVGCASFQMSEQDKKNFKEQLERERQRKSEPYIPNPKYFKGDK